MKKILISLLAVCLAAVPALKAQKYQQTYYKQIHPNEISASYGVSVLGITFNNVISKASIISDFIGDDVTVGKGSTGAINLGYSYQLNKTISVGAALGFNRLGFKVTDETGSLKPHVNIWMLMTTAKFDWFRTRSDIFGMYSKVGAGVMALAANLDMEDNLKKTLWLPTGHLSLIGLEVGRGFSGFMELGFGMQGIAQFGIRARF